MYLKCKSAIEQKSDPSVPAYRQAGLPLVRGELKSPLEASLREESLRP